MQPFVDLCSHSLAMVRSSTFVSSRQVACNPAILLTTDSVGEKKEKMVVKEMDAVDVTLGSQDGLVHRKRDPFL